MLLLFLTPIFVSERKDWIGVYKSNGFGKLKVMVLGSSIIVAENRDFLNQKSFLPFPERKSHFSDLTSPKKSVIHTIWIYTCVTIRITFSIFSFIA